MSRALRSVLNIPFEKTTEPQRQLLACFSFGMVYALGQIKKLTAPEIHALYLMLLLDVFQHSEAQAAAFAEHMIKCAGGRGDSTINAVIHRGIDGHRPWDKGRMSELKSNIEHVFKTAGA